MVIGLRARDEPREVENLVREFKQTDGGGKIQLQPPAFEFKPILYGGLGLFHDLNRVVDEVRREEGDASRSRRACPGRNLMCPDRTFCEVFRFNPLLSPLFSTGIRPFQFFTRMCFVLKFCHRFLPSLESIFAIEALK
jgi:hypothetical protein